MIDVNISGSSNASCLIAISPTRRRRTVLIDLPINLGGNGGNPGFGGNDFAARTALMASGIAASDFKKSSRFIVNFTFKSFEQIVKIIGG